MPWPSDIDFVNALQNPASAFEDASLRHGRVETDPLGLPKSRAGNFAIVFKVTTGGRDWAIRCFKGDWPDRQDRYLAIDRHLGSANLPCLSPFAFIQRGIRVNGAWYPILKMEWLSGELLRPWLERNLRNSDKLRQLASQWIQTVSALKRANIGHGDLQHGNVVISNDQVRLIDYDSMYVPALSGRESPERGHENYQHPSRGGKHFGPYIDDFSAWVVYISLVALSIEPSLWSRFAEGHESLLFRKTDFLDPAKSAVFAALATTPDPRLRLLATTLQGLLRLPIESLPTLAEQYVPGAGEVSLVCTGCGQRLRVALQSDSTIVRCPACKHEHVWKTTAGTSGSGTHPSVRAEWWRTDLPERGLTLAAPSPLGDIPPPVVEASLWDPVEACDSSWIFQSLSEAHPAHAAQFGAAFWPDRLVLLVSLLVLATLIYVMMIGAFSIGGDSAISGLCVTVALANPVVWWARYRRHPAHIVGLAHRRQQRQVAGDLRRLALQRRDCKAAHDALRKEHDRRAGDLTSKQKQLHAESLRALTQEAGGVAKNVQQLQDRLNRETQAISAERASVQSRRDAQLANVLRTLQALPAEEAAAVSDCNQREHLECTTIQATVSARTAELQRNIASAQAEEASLIQQAADAKAAQFIHDGMTRTAIPTQGISGIGPAIRSKLIYAGFRTAADIGSGVGRVHGVGPSRVHALLGWKRDVESRLRRQSPRLTEDEARRIREHWATQVNQWRSELHRLASDVAIRQQQVRAMYGARRTAIADDIAKRRGALEVELENMRSGQAQEERALEARLSSRIAPIKAELGRQEAVLAAAKRKVEAAFTSRLQILATERKQLDDDMVRRGRAIEGSLMDIRRAETAATFRQAKVEFESKGAVRITFGRYVQGVFGVGR